MMVRQFVHLRQVVRNLAGQTGIGSEIPKDAIPRVGNAFIY